MNEESIVVTKKSTIDEHFTQLHLYRVQRMSGRIKAGKCCDTVHPNGTGKWRFCQNPAYGMYEDLTYCKKHLERWLAIKAKDEANGFKTKWE